LVRGGRSSSTGQVTYVSFGVNVALTAGAAVELAGSSPSPRVITAVMVSEEINGARLEVISDHFQRGLRGLSII
jgi:hypothetical protein